MSSDAIKAMLREWFDHMNQPDWAEWVRRKYPTREVAEFIAEHSIFRQSFPDYHFTVERLLVDGDHVAIYGEASGTHSSEFPLADLKGIPASGRQLTWHEAHFFRIAPGNTWVDYRLLVDSLARLQQLGVIPVT